LGASFSAAFDPDARGASRTAGGASGPGTARASAQDTVGASAQDFEHSLAAPPPSRCEVAVVGAGLLGLAVARELIQRHPRWRVCVLERESRPGAHQSSHNSGVIHAGIYYQPGSLKARLCVQGARALYEYCEAHAIPHERCGKLIVALDQRELPGLDELERRGNANGVPGLRRVDAGGLREIEPHCRGIAALHSPATGIVDYGALTEALAREVLGRGGSVSTACAVRGVRILARSVALEHERGTTDATHAVFCAGAWADRLAMLGGAGADPRIVPFRGAYLRLVPERRALVRALIYPVPDPSLPFLGVHLTRHIDGDVLIGPTALPAAARDAYRLRRVRARDVRDTVTWRGTWRMARRWWRTGLTEIHHAVLPGALARDAARYVPELRARDTEPAFAGLRAQAVDREGRLVDDFVFSVTGRALHVRNAPSPGATASIAIASHIADRASAAFGW
jgi:L-2-hydroxyglutarate oxidase